MEENNFFGFVSKIGSLIGTNKPKETKKPKVVEKKYNIKISSEVENEKEMDNIDNPIDINEEEEEEEEDDEEENKETLEEKEKREEKEKTEKEEKDKIQNMVLDILNDNDNQKKEEESKEDLNENIINEGNDNNIKNINNEYINLNNKNCPQILNNAFPVSNDKNDINNAFIYDETSSCHLMLKKGNDININDYIIFPILFMEKQKNLFYKIGMTNNPSYEEKKYIFFFDEHYLYFAKDEIISEEMDDDTRRITKIVSLFDIKDFSNDHINEQFFIKLTIQKDLKPEKIISFYIEENNFTGFIKNFNLKLSIYGIDFFTDKNNSI